MIKLPVKDPDTVPWMSKREIPAIKFILSAWRARRKDPTFSLDAKDAANRFINPQHAAETRAHLVAPDLEVITAIDERLRKEARDAK